MGDGFFGRGERRARHNQGERQNPRRGGGSVNPEDLVVEGGVVK
jgi:hypothetical protein